MIISLYVLTIIKKLISDNISAIVISGGHGAYTSVEMFRPSDGKSCELPPLPEARAGHTHGSYESGSLELCGGENRAGGSKTPKSCIVFSSGKFFKTLFSSVKIIY